MRDGDICRVPGCEALRHRPSHDLLCRHHWRRVPHHLRAELRDAIAGWRRADTTLARRDALMRLRHAQAAAIAAASGNPQT